MSATRMTAEAARQAIVDELLAELRGASGARSAARAWRDRLGVARRGMARRYSAGAQRDLGAKLRLTIAALDAGATLLRDLETTAAPRSTFREDGPGAGPMEGSEP